MTTGIAFEEPDSDEELDKTSTLFFCTCFSFAGFACPLGALHLKHRVREAKQPVAPQALQSQSRFTSFFAFIVAVCFFNSVKETFASA